jgi:hypothetical protein
MSLEASFGNGEKPGAIDEEVKHLSYITPNIIHILL